MKITHSKYAVLSEMFSKVKKKIFEGGSAESERNKERSGEGGTLSSCYKPFNYHGQVERQILLSFYNKEK